MRPEEHGFKGDVDPYEKAKEYQVVDFDPEISSSSDGDKNSQSSTKNMQKIVKDHQNKNELRNEL